MTTVIPIIDETNLLIELKGDTITLVRMATQAQPMKILLTIHDIIELNLDIKFRFPKETSWDKSSIEHMKTVKRELYIYHRNDFTPVYSFDKYNEKMETFLGHVDFRHLKGA
jgi:hypothetical protein